MTSTRAWISYTIVRLLAFALPCAGIMLALPTWEWNWLLGVGVGALVSALVSYLFLRKQRQAMTAGMIARREAKHASDVRGEDELAEDEALDDAAESSLEHDVPKDPSSDDTAADDADKLDEELAPATEDVEPVEQRPAPEDVVPAHTSSLEIAPSDR
ncbi:DUF4229 domain-containing protein [Pseudoclavibacter alba]|uniref:DUF4229 domain-containing protein n=1 Tax=Pseudoclavibacter albus TaxID=272241 RepID=UPI0019D2A9F6|nr:DUF4229 domain-containing protein [Pseudoclavibacter alba]MBN6778595.1 DUF4229 domain-containing protein [Pseudoclavibacter alba]